MRNKRQIEARDFAQLMLSSGGTNAADPRLGAGNWSP
jgi:hypothetical protein